MRASRLFPIFLASSSILALRPNMPISIAEIFWPPTMNYVAWLPGDESCICTSAVPISENKVFSIGGEDGFTYEGFWGKSMKLMKDGIEIADCSVGPDSIRVEQCEPTRYNGDVFGIVSKRWSCWTRGKESKMEDASKGASGTRGGAAKPYWES